jgi:hypothetical protein
VLSGDAASIYSTAAAGEASWSRIPLSDCGAICGDTTPTKSVRSALASLAEFPDARHGRAGAEVVSSGGVRPAERGRGVPSISRPGIHDRWRGVPSICPMKKALSVPRWTDTDGSTAQIMRMRGGWQNCDDGSRAAILVSSTGPRTEILNRRKQRQRRQLRRGRWLLHRSAPRTPVSLMTAWQLAREPALTGNRLWANETPTAADRLTVRRCPTTMRGAEGSACGYRLWGDCG